MPLSAAGARRAKHPSGLGREEPGVEALAAEHDLELELEQDENEHGAEPEREEAATHEHGVELEGEQAEHLFGTGWMSNVGEENTSWP